MDEGESSLQGAIRELGEETWLVGRGLEPAAEFGFGPFPGSSPFTELLAFGSPRREGKINISQAAANLLREAAARSDIDPAACEDPYRRYAWFDALADMPVRWRQWNHFHVLALAGRCGLSGGHRPNHVPEMDELRWVSLSEVQQDQQGKASFFRDLVFNTAFAAAIERAAEQAQDSTWTSRRFIGWESASE
jgi:hypothetical protein